MHYIKREEIMYTFSYFKSNSYNSQLYFKNLKTNLKFQTTLL